MSISEMNEMNEVTQLAETFSTACKKVVEEGKVETYAAPVVMVAETVLIAPADAKVERYVLAWWP